MERAVRRRDQSARAVAALARDEILWRGLEDHVPVLASDFFDACEPLRLQDAVRRHRGLDLLQQRSGLGF
jgi:hypothetical protein